MSYFSKFPAMGKKDLRDFKKSIDGAYKDFSREYGEAIENFFDPLYYFLTWFEKLLNATPWPIIILIIGHKLKVFY